jgi:hypothetical protein
MTKQKISRGPFSSTTKLDGKVTFSLGSSDLGNTDNTEAWQYMYQLNLNSSFTGDDNLYVRLKSGDEGMGSFLPNYVPTSSDSLKVDKIWYYSPIGDQSTFIAGPKIENYYMFATPSIYQPVLKAFKLGGNASAYGASTSPGLGLNYDFDNGLTFSATLNGNTEGDFFGSPPDFTTQIAYNRANYHLSASYRSKSKGSCSPVVSDTFSKDGNYYNESNEELEILSDKINIKNRTTNVIKEYPFTSYRYTKKQVDEYDYIIKIFDKDCLSGWNPLDKYATESVDTLRQTQDSTGWGLRGWWRPDETGTAVPSISVGYDTNSFDNNTDASGYSVGLSWQDMIQADDKIGLAFGQPLNTPDVANVDPFLYEVYYSFKANDSVTVTPTIFGGSDVQSNTSEDRFGYVLQTTFKF